MSVPLLLLLLLGLCHTSLHLHLHLHLNPYLLMLSLIFPFCSHYNNLVMVDWRDRRLGANRTINFALNSSDVGPDMTTQSLPPFTNPCNNLYNTYHAQNSSHYAWTSTPWPGMAANLSGEEWMDATNCNARYYSWVNSVRVIR
jgi:hypothetical protein